MQEPKEQELTDWEEKLKDAHELFDLFTHAAYKAGEI